MVGLTFVLLIVAIGVLVLIPTRRLFLGGWTPGALALYFAGMVALGLLVAEVRGPARYLVPVFVLAYIAPFVTIRQGLARVRERLGGGSAPPPNVNRAAEQESPNVRDARPRSAPRNVTPPDGTPPGPSRRA